MSNDKSKTFGFLLVTGIATYAMNYASLRGINFEVFGVPSEIVKSAIVGHLIAFYDWVTPDNLVDATTQGILWIRGACAKIHGALTLQLQQMRKK